MKRLITIESGKKLLLLVLVLAVLVGLSGEAYAGSNGQQLKIICTNCRINRVTVVGTNQNGQPATWSSPTFPVIFPPTSVTTTGWWWVGNVNITLQSSSNRTYNCTAVVPRTYRSDVFDVRCP
jgi:hypothetical protein